MEHLPDESRLMLRTIRDLAALAALSADWVGGRPLQVAEGLADLLVRTLDLDFAYIRLYVDQVEQHEMEVARAVHLSITEVQTQKIGQALAPWLDRARTNDVQSVANPLGSGTVRIIVVRIGQDGEEGVFAAGSHRSDFPGEEDRLRLNLVARQAAIALQCRRAEDARRRLLRERDELLARLQLQFELMPIACIVFDTQICIIDWNPAAEKIFGYRREEVVGTSGDLLLIPPSGRERAREINRRVASGEKITHVITDNVTKDGHIIHCDWHNTPLRDADGEVIAILTMAQDITDRIRAEEAIDESQRRFRAVFENSLDGILLIDDAGHFVDANPATCQFLGYSRAELMRMTVWEVTPASDRNRIPGLLGRFLADGVLSGEYTMLCKGGATREVEYRSVKNILPGVHLGVHRDITERKQVEQELRNRHNLLQAVIESIPDAIYVKDRDGRHLMINSHGARFGGRTVAEMIGRDAGALFDPETAQSIRESDRQVMESEASTTHEQVTIKAGVSHTYLTSTVPFRNADGIVVGVLGISRDITESKALQTDRDRLLERLRLQIDRLPLAYILLDEKHHVLNWNPAAERMFGYTKAEALGRLCFDLILRHPIDHKILEVVRRVEAGDLYANSVNENCTKDGRIITCQWFNTPLTDPDGDFTGVICVAQDISERQRTEQALQDSAVRLQTTSRRVVEVQEEERRHLARELHDEIGQVLSAISVNLHAVKGVCDAATIPRIEESIQIVDQATQQVRNLSLDLRPSMLDDLGLVATVRWYADRQAQRAGFAVQLAVESSGARLPAELRTACFRVVQEALTNVERHARARHVWVEFRQGDDEVELAIRDDGVGFDPEIARSRSARGEGSGLVGLLERVELLGGRADIRSQPGQGTSIGVWFPAYTRAVDAGAE